MRESKYSFYILGVILFVNLIIILCVQNESSAVLKIFSASFGGVAVSWVIAIITYFAEERKLIYNFYAAAERYAEKLRCFSQYLSDSYAYFEKVSNENEKRRIVEVVLERLERVFDELYEEYIIIQKETREFEAFHIRNTKRYDIKWYMRKFYDSIKDDVNYIKNCVELNYRNKLLERKDYEKLKSDFHKLCSFFGEKEKNENVFILIKLKPLDYILNIFIERGFMALRDGGKIIRNVNYEASCYIENNEKNQNFSNGMVPSQYSVTHKPKASKHEKNWINEI